MDLNHPRFDDCYVQPTIFDAVTNIYGLQVAVWTRDKSLHAFDKYTEMKTTWIRLDSPF